ncbi:MAG TPA: thymidine kinase, partial [Rhodobacteraceae bacterium]|nr:thymidine kinase [Paracoccaceae bacterium]
MSRPFLFGAFIFILILTLPARQFIAKTLNMAKLYFHYST